MNQKQRNLAFGLASIIGVISQATAQINFLFLKTAFTYMNASPINEHYGNEYAIYYFTLGLSTIAAFIILRKDSLMQFAAVWSINLIGFSNEYGSNTNAQKILLGMGVAMLALLFKIFMANKNKKTEKY